MKNLTTSGTNTWFSNVAGYKVNMQKSIAYLSNEQEESEIKNTMPFTLIPPQNEILVGQKCVFPFIR